MRFDKPHDAPPEFGNINNARGNKSCVGNIRIVFVHENEGGEFFNAT